MGDMGGTACSWQGSLRHGLDSTLGHKSASQDHSYRRTGLSLSASPSPMA